MFAHVAEVRTTTPRYRKRARTWPRWCPADERGPVSETVLPVRVPAGGSARWGSLVGRDRELAALVDLVAAPDVQLVSVTGHVGVGKSRLLAELVQTPAATLEMIVIAVGLGLTTGSGLAADSLLAALSPPHEVSSTPAQALWQLAGGAPVLLALDDCDQAEGLADLLLDLLDAYPELKVVATRVRPFGVPGERLVTLKSFPLPGPSADGLAVELFAARAAAADADFVLDPGTREAVAAVCRALGGLPLAIELAAARVAAVPPASMARQLERSLDLLHQDGRRGVPDRHRSLEAALDWSIGLLSPPAADLLAQLSVFAGGFPLAAARQVASPRRADPELLDLVSELVDVHLVDLRQDALEAPEQDVQFQLDPLACRNARRRLAEGGGESRARDAHADYWASCCRTNPATATRAWPDVLAALDWRVVAGQRDEALQLAVAMAPALTSSPGAEASLLPLVESVLGDGSVSDEALVARTLMWATVHSPAKDTGIAAYGAWTARRLRTSIELARSSRDDVALLEALELVVHTLGVTFDLEGAVACAHEGHALAHRLGDEAALARFEVWVAMAHGLAGSADEMARSARSAYERGLRAGDNTAVVHGALMLHGLPAGEQGPLPLLGLDDLLGRAEASHQPPLVMHVLGAVVLSGLALGDEHAVASAFGRMLLIAEGIDRTWPMASVGPLMLVALAAVSRGAVEDAVLVRESMAEIEPVLSDIAPSLAPAYFAAVTPLREVVLGERYDALATQVRGLTLRRANRLAQAMVRDYLPPQPVTLDPPATSLSAPAAASAPSTLTPRELDVLGQLVTGRTNREIADVLGMAPKTVMHHTVAIYRKLGVRGRAEAVARAVRSGTVLPD